MLLPSPRPPRPKTRDEPGRKILRPRFDPLLDELGRKPASALDLLAVDAEASLGLGEKNLDELEIGRLARGKAGDPDKLPFRLDPELLPQLADGAVVVAFAGIDVARGAAVPLASVGVLEMGAELQVDLAELVPDQDMHGAVEMFARVDLASRQGVDDDIVLVDGVERLGRGGRQETARMRVETIGKIDPLLQRELLGPGALFEPHRAEDLLRLLLLELEVVVELLAALRETALHDLAVDLGGMRRQFAGRAGIESHDRRIDGGTRVKELGAHGPQRGDGPALPQHQGEDPVVLAARLGDKTFGDLFLHHYDGLVDGAGRIEETLEDGVADGIGQVADELHRTLEKERSHIVFGRVGMDDLDAERSEPFLEILREASVRLDKNEPSTFAREVFGKGAETRTDLDDAVLGSDAQLRGDPLRSRRIDEKTLPQLSARGQVVAAEERLEIGEVHRPKMPEFPRDASRKAPRSPQDAITASRPRLESLRITGMGRDFGGGKVKGMRCLLPLLVMPFGLAQANPVSFNRDVRPILSDHCFNCHGPDEGSRKADLRLDLPGADLAAVMERVSSGDPDEVMPPPKFQKPLAAAQIETLDRWIAEGAPYEKHWAFSPLDPGEHEGIDAQVAAALREHGLDFAPEAHPATLARRVSLDLTGLPPEAHSGAPLDDYERFVDSLLASPHFGEHLAVSWLDAARYADTNGYFGDKPRQMWLWRDWVVRAFNENLPYDRFTLEQLAGDLLPDPTVAQRVATGFNRNHIANNETGIVDEEYRVEYVVDRVDATMSTWLGLTAACAQCHDHKYDPISQREFYQLFAFFNNVPEKGLITDDDPPPRISVPTPEQENALAAAQEELKAAKTAFATVRKALLPSLAPWEAELPSQLSPLPEPFFLESFEGRVGSETESIGTDFVYETGLRGEAANFDATRHLEASVAGFDPDGPWTIAFWLKAESSLGCPLSLIEPYGERRGLEILWQKGRLEVHLVHHWGVDAIEVATVSALSSRTWHHVVVSYDGGGKAAGLRVRLDGKEVPLEIHRDTLAGTIRNDEPLRLGRRDDGLGFYGALDEVRLVAGALDEAASRDWHRSERLRGTLERPPEARTEADLEAVLADYLEHRGEASAKAAKTRLAEAERSERELREALPTSLVMEEMAEPRTTHLLERGLYDAPGDIVTPGVPETVAPWHADFPPNRLGLAQWILQEENPLAARVAVNRLWRQLFGEGLVRTVDDYGSQGEPPTHPELLDWLALEFRRGGWDVKALLKILVLSRTYRQDSARRPGLDDPDNRLLARGPSGRLPAETIRDQALAVSGLLVPTLGGPSVKPYQPPGLWEAVSYNGEESYLVGSGDDLWRRTLYTYIKRQSPPPLLLTFDGPTREKCTLARARTNTPLQALLLLNDETFVEAARALAQRTLAGTEVSDAAASDPDRILAMWRRVLARDPGEGERDALLGLLARQRSRLGRDPEAAAALLSVGKAPRDEALDPVEHAAWTVVAHTLLNLDETLTKR